MLDLTVDELLQKHKRPSQEFLEVDELLKKHKHPKELEVSTEAFIKPEFQPAESITTTVEKPTPAKLIKKEYEEAIGKYKKVKLDPFGSLRGVVYAINAAPQALGLLAKEFGERMEENPDFWDYAMSGPTLGLSVVQKKIMSAQAKKTDLDEKIVGFADDIIKKNRENLKELTMIHPRRGKINELLFNLGAGGVSIAGALGIAYLTKSKAAAATMFGLYAKALSYGEARKGIFTEEEKKTAARLGLFLPKTAKTPKQAGRLSTIRGGVEGGLEYVGLELIMGKYAGKLFGTMATEGFQEFSQEVGGNFVMKTGYDPARNIWQGAWEAGVTGLILGAPASVVTGAIERSKAGALLTNGGVDVGETVNLIEKRAAPELEKITKEEIKSIETEVKKEKAKPKAEIGEIKMEEGPLIQQVYPSEKTGVEMEKTVVDKTLYPGVEVGKPVPKQLPSPEITAPVTREDLLTRTFETSIGTIEVPLSDLSGDPKTDLELISKYGNYQGGIKPNISRSLSVGDEVAYEGHIYTVAPYGFTPKAFKLEESAGIELENKKYKRGQVKKISPELAQNIIDEQIPPKDIDFKGDFAEGKYLDDEGAAISKETNDMLREGDDFWDIVNRECGGIAPYTKGIPGALTEEYRSIPIGLRNKGGLHLDKAADYLKRHHPEFAINDEADLLEYINMRYGPGMQMHGGLNILKAWEGLKDFYSSKVGQPAYDMMGKLVPSFVKQAMTPYHNWNEYVKTLYREMIYDRIAKQADTKIVHNAFKKLSDKELIASYYLATDQALPSGIELTQKAQDVSRLIKDEFNKLGGEAVKIGLMSEASFKKYFDKYLPRLYEIYERTKKSPSLFKKTLKLDFRRYMQRNEDLPEVWREAAGEIKDVKELFTKGTLQHIHDVTLAKFQTRLKNLPADFTEGYKVVLTPKEFEVAEVGPYTYTQLPNNKKYGILKNQYIRDDVYIDLKGMFMTPGRWATAGRIHKKLLTLWKLSKTVLSPATQARNFYFGIIQCDWGDGWNTKAIAKFTEAIYKKNDLYRELRHNAILSSGMVKVEMTDYLRRFKNTNNKIENVIDVFSDMLMNKLRGRWAANLYQASDDLFRSLIYTSQRLKGKSQTKARDLANFYMVNYREVSPFIEAMRMGPSPFITFYNGFAQAAAHTAIIKPWKLAKWYLFLLMIGAKGLKEPKELKERKAAAMPSYLPHVIPGIPAVRLPWETQRGEDLYLDMTYVIPFLDMQIEVLKMAKGELKPLHPAVALGRASIRMFNHPGLRWMADVAMHGKDPFLGTDLDTPDKIADYTYKQLMPPFAPEIPFSEKILGGEGIEGGWGWMGIKRAIKKTPSSGRGYIRGVPEAIGRHALGVKTIPVDYIAELNSRIRYARFLMGEETSKIYRIAKDKALSQKQKDKRIEEVKDEIKKLGGQIKDWKGQKEWFEERTIKEEEFLEVDELLKKHKRPK